jgi:glycosyltransferase involved in cell wall biosynthesis
MSRAKVTVGIPAYDRPESLQRAILSVLSQNYPDFVVIVSDDASPSCDLASCMKSHGIDDDRIIYIRQGENIGSESNFKFVLSQSTTEYFAWLADDDTIAADFLKSLVAVLDADSSVALAMCDVDAVRNSTGERWVERITSLRSDVDWSSALEMLFSDQRLNTFYCLYGVYRSSVLKKIDFRVNSRWKKLNTDWEVPFLASVALRGRIVSIDEVLKTYYFNEGSVYHKELSMMTSSDRLLLRLDLMARVSALALSSTLPLTQRARLAASPWVVNIRRLVTKIFRRFW